MDYPTIYSDKQHKKSTTKPMDKSEIRGYPNVRSIEVEHKLTLSN
jgi:hypothetical protein